MDHFSSIVARWSIPQDQGHIAGDNALLDKILIVVTARNYLFNSLTTNEVYVPAVTYWEWHSAFVAESGKLLLKLLSQLPPPNGMRALLLEHEMEHASLLILDYRVKTFFVVDPRYGHQCYGYVREAITPLLQEILPNWKYDDRYEREATCAGPMDRTNDDYCYSWCLMISAVCVRVADLELFLDDLDTLSTEELNILIARFISHLYNSLVEDGSVEVFRAINVNQEGFCFQTVSNVIDTMCSVKYYDRAISPADFMSRYVQELANIQSGCNMKNLSS